MGFPPLHQPLEHGLRRDIWLVHATGGGAPTWQPLSLGDWATATAAFDLKSFSCHLLFILALPETTCFILRSFSCLFHFDRFCFIFVFISCSFPRQMKDPR